MKLVYDDTGAPVQIGDKVKDFRGDVHEVVGTREPHKPGSSGRVYVKDSRAALGIVEYFPTVFRMHWVS